MAKKRITEDSIFYRGKGPKAPILRPSNISNFPKLFGPYGSGSYARKAKKKRAI